MLNEFAVVLSEFTEYEGVLLGLGGVGKEGLTVAEDQSIAPPVLLVCDDSWGREKEAGWSG